MLIIIHIFCDIIYKVNSNLYKFNLKNMNILRKVFFALFLFVGVSLAGNVSAMTPTVSFSADQNNSSLVQVVVNGDANSGVILKYYSSTASGPQMKSLGMTSSSGYFSGSITLSEYNIPKGSAIGVLVNGQLSSDISWPYESTTSSTNITLSQASVVLNVGQSNTVTASNTGSNSLYLLSNASPQVANISFSGNQITVVGLSSGQTTANICVVNSTSNSNCVNLYIIVQNSSSQSLSFSQNNTSIISGQNIQITVTGGNGFYKVQNNSNSSAISASLNGPLLTLYANGVTGSSTITVCSSDMGACGIVNASIGTYTSSGTGLSFSQTYPTITMGQTSVINISGGYGTYYISSNSNSNIAQTYISTSTVTIYGNNPGTTAITVCAPSGQCGTINPTVVASSGGALVLSQNNVGLVSGQVISVTISGGTAPYSVIHNSDGIAQYSLNGSVITITGVSAGSSNTTVCSSAGACVTLNANVTSSSGSSVVSGVQPVFSQNNVSVNTNQTAAVYLSGNGGYYVSTNSNPAVISASVSGSSLVLSGITTGSSNISVCQTGGQCNTLYVTVSNSGVSNVNSVPITFNKSSVSMYVGGIESVSVSGGSGFGYYVSYNSNSSAIGVYVSGSTLSISGKAAGSGTLSICSSSNVCASISVTVLSKTIAISKYTFTKPLKFGSEGEEVTQLQKRLTSEGVYSGPITGYYGNLTVAAVKKYQKSKKLDQLGNVGPGTRAALNK
jgi:hypothetical protein